MIRRLVVLGAALLLLSACGGGGSGSSQSSSETSTLPVPSTPTSAPAPALSNFTAIIVDAGPAVLDTGPNAYVADNVAFVTVTVCAPGTTNCQTIDHIQLDTGSTGLRIAHSVLNPNLLAAMPSETDASANPVGECYAYVDGYAFGSVRKADFQIGGEAVFDMPLQLIGDTGVFSSVPSTCASGGGTNLNSVQLLGANGVLGVGVQTTDCGTACQTPGVDSSAIYFDCPTSGCASVITRTASTTAPFQQLPNPVAAMSVDNNGTVISFPSVPAGGEASLAGTLYFGIGTQTNNGLGSATVLTTTTSASPMGAGFVTTLYQNNTLSLSFIDAGSNFYAFDSTLTPCTGADKGYYCPQPSAVINPTIEGANGTTATPQITINNAATLFSTTYTVLPGIGANPNQFTNLTPYPSSFDFGLPFFYGRSIYTALEGRSAGGVIGPYYAF